MTGENFTVFTNIRGVSQKIAGSCSDEDSVLL